MCARLARGRGFESHSGQLSIFENICRPYQISSEVNKLTRIKFVVSIFVFAMILYYLIRSLSINIPINPGNLNFLR